MALIRLTAENANEVIQQVVGDFADLVRTSGKSPALVKLQERAAEMEGLVRSGVLETEVILGEVGDKWVGPVAEWLQIDEAILKEAITSQEQIDLPPQLDRRFSVVRIRSGHQPAGRRAGQRTPPILVVVHTPEPAPEKNLKDALFDAVQEHPLSLLLVPAEAGWAKALSNLASRETWMCKAIGLELTAERSLEENLELSPWKEARAMMVGWSAAGSMGSLYEGLGLALEKEKGSLRSKRTVLDQNAAVSQQKRTGNASDIIAEARSLIQKQFDIFQKQSAKRMQSLVAQFDGTLSQEIEATIKGILEFDFEKKPKIFVVRVPEAVQKELIIRTKEVLAEAGKNDLIAMGEVFRKVQEDVEKLIEAKGGPPTVAHFDYLPDHELTTLLERSIGIQRPYSGSLARRGPMDYFMAARRYQMIFFMMFSAFGLSFVRSYRQIMVPLTVLLLSFGLLNVVNSTRKQEKETQLLELEKARELLRAEMRRCMNEVDKNWSSLLSNHLSGQQAAVLEKIESAVSSFFEGASRKASDDKILQQRQLKGLDLADRKIGEASKRVQAAPQEIEQLHSQFTQMFTVAVRPAEGGPRVAGAAQSPATPAAAVPTEAAEALKKLQAAKKQAAGARPAAGAAAADLKKKLAEVRSKGAADRQTPTTAKPEKPAAKPARPAAEGSSDLAARVAKLKERAAAMSQSSEAPEAAPVEASAAGKVEAAGSDEAEKVHPKRAAVENRVAELQKKMEEAKAAEKSPEREPAADRGALMKKKAEEIKRKMAAATDSDDSSADLDKTVMMPKRPISRDKDTSD